MVRKKRAKGARGQSWGRRGERERKIDGGRYLGSSFNGLWSIRSINKTLFMKVSSRYFQKRQACELMDQVAPSVGWRSEGKLRLLSWDILSSCSWTKEFQASSALDSGSYTRNSSFFNFISAEGETQASLGLLRLTMQPAWQCIQPLGKMAAAGSWSSL